VHQLQRGFFDNPPFVFRHSSSSSRKRWRMPTSSASAARRKSAARSASHPHPLAPASGEGQAVGGSRSNLRRTCASCYYAVELGLDSTRFARDRTSPEVESRINRDLASGERSGAPGTPTFYVNGIRHDGGYSIRRR
jgi:2-hydroxychromene-2-carboxylate isomerase